MAGSITASTIRLAIATTPTNAGEYQELEAAMLPRVLNQGFGVYQCPQQAAQCSEYCGSTTEHVEALIEDLQGTVLAGQR